jgi:hypothetical protein
MTSIAATALSRSLGQAAEPRVHPREAPGHEKVLAQRGMPPAGMHSMWACSPLRGGRLLTYGMKNGSVSC